jgi:hypothetical protein
LFEVEWGKVFVSRVGGNGRVRGGHGEGKGGAWEFGFKRYARAERTHRLFSGARPPRI